MLKLGVIMANEYVLYYKPECPYCQKVLAFLEEAKLELPMKNIHEGTIQQDLINIGGKKQVPCLIINGEALYESDDIIKFLKENEVK